MTKVSNTYEIPIHSLFTLNKSVKLASDFWTKISTDFGVQAQFLHVPLYLIFSFLINLSCKQNHKHVSLYIFGKQFSLLDSI